MITTAQSTDTAEFIRHVVAPGSVLEVRCPDCPDSKGARFTACCRGYFNDPDAAAKAIQRIESISEPRGIYITQNPIRPELAARAFNKTEFKAKTTTDDSGILHLTRLFIDIDSTRPAGVSATNDEVQQAINLAHRIQDTLSKRGWPLALMAMSGNGAYLIFAVDLENTPENVLLIKHVLHGMANEFNTAGATVDTSTFNPSRIIKAIGTTARKGDNIVNVPGLEDRPHRQTWFVPPAGPLEIVDVALLRAIAKEPASKTPAQMSSPAASNGKAVARKSRSKGASVQKRCQAYIDKMPDSIQGQKGSDKLFNVVCECGRFGLSEDDALPIVTQYATERSQPPWSEHEIQHKLADGYAQVRAAGEFGSRLDVDRNGAAATSREQGYLDTRPVIDVTVRDLRALTEETWAVIGEANEPPQLFRHGGVASRIEHGDSDEPVIRSIDFNRLRHFLANIADWRQTKKSKDETTEVAVAPPRDLVENVLATPNMPLPILSRFVEAPVFARDGSLQTTPGYHPASQTIYAPADGFVVEDIPEHPTSDDIEAATNILADELLGDFPFTGESEKAHAIAFMILPFVRDLIDGATPLHLFEKPTPGTGATLLVDMLAFPALGRHLPTMTEARDEDEWRKRLTSKLKSGAAFMFIDNLSRRFDSPAMASAITSPLWEDRLLGGNEVCRIPVRCGWGASGNNPSTSSEMARRIVRSRMDAKVDRPWLRTEFRHPDLRSWAAKNRPLLVWSILTLGQAWLAAGRPEGGQTLGMFESWSKVIGGILDVARIPGFLANLAEFYEDSDVEGAVWRAFLSAWWTKFEGRDVKTADLYPLATADGCLSLGDGNEQSQRVVLGKMLIQKRDRVFDVMIGDSPQQLVFTRGDKKQGAYLWALKRPK